jgi:hypothetical protein
VAEHVSHATFLPGRMLRSTPPQTPNCSLRSSAAWRHSTSTGQRLHHLTAIARWAACSAVHSSRVMGSLQRGRSPSAARDRSARLSSSVAVMGWPALGVRRHGRFRGVNTFRRHGRFNVAAPKAGGSAPGAVCVDRTCKWGHRVRALIWLRAVRGLRRRAAVRQPRRPGRDGGGEPPLRPQGRRRPGPPGRAGPPSRVEVVAVHLGRRRRPPVSSTLRRRLRRPPGRRG